MNKLFLLLLIAFPVYAANFVFFGEGTTTNVEPVLEDGRQCAVTLPSNLPADEMYLMWPNNEFGYGKPVAINKTEAWWVGPDTVATGETFSIYGRNLDLGSATNFLYCEEYGAWLTNTTANPY